MIKRNRFAFGLGYFLISLTAGSCTWSDSGLSSDALTLSEIKKNRAALDGQVVLANGFLLMSDTDMNIVSKLTQDSDQVCLGVLVTEASFEKLRKYDHHWVQILATLHVDRCKGREYCPYSCSTTVFSNVSVKKLLPKP